MIQIRPACHGDIAAIEAMLAPHIAAGELLDKPISADHFLVATERGVIVGSVALTPITPSVVELGSLVSTRRRQGLGRRLVDHALRRAGAQGFELIMALTALPEFFKHVGFKVSAHAPWMSARRSLDLPSPIPIHRDAYALKAAEAKASACCQCPRLLTCQQVQMLYVLAQDQRRMG